MSCSRLAQPFVQVDLMKKYFFLEPVGGSPPKFTLETKTLTMERVSEDPLSLSCPAQGSPVPAYRLVPLSFPFSEPIGGSAPKFTLDSKLSLVERKFAQPLTLVCPAQGSPVPGYRSLHLTSTNSNSFSPKCPGWPILIQTMILIGELQSRWEAPPPNSW